MQFFAFTFLVGLLCVLLFGKISTTESTKKGSDRIKRSTEEGTIFTLYTRENPNKSEKISVHDPESLKKISQDKPSSYSLKFLIHGWQSNAKTSWVADMVYTLLEYEDYYVITVDWENAASSFDYIKVASTEIHKVAHDVATLVNKLVEQQKVSASDIHIIAHSLGAHIAGFAGKNIRNLGWIAGLDPAGPRFREKTREERLDRSDAQFVEIVSTDGAYLTFIFSDQLGLEEPIGHLNFYPNGGKSLQPGCKYFKACSHSRATDLYAESYKRNKCQMKGYECKDIRYFNEGQCKGCGPDGSKCAFMGPLSVFNPTRGDDGIKLFYETNWKPPYCLFHIHITLALALQENGLSSMYGRVKVTVFGDIETIYNIWPDSNLPEDNFYHESGKKQFILLAKHNVGSIKSVNVEWLNSKSKLPLYHVTAHVMENENPPFIGCPDGGSSYTAVNLGSGIDSTFKHICDPILPPV